MTRPSNPAPPRRRARRAAWPVLAAALAATSVPSCTLVLSRDVEQCDRNADCAKLGDFECDVGEGVCVAASVDSGFFDLAGVIDADKTLTPDREYLLKGVVVVAPGATLTLEPGVVVHGDYASKGALVVARGAKIIAQGEADKPIVFTSSQADAERRRGDWGGVAIFGNARVNRLGDGQNDEARVEGLNADPYGSYGGGDDADNSGVLKYVRIEYAGGVPGDTIDGLTLGGVGSGTVVDHVQVRMVADDCFEFSGGTVRAKYLACQAPFEDGIGWKYGYRGALQFVVVQNGVFPDSGKARGLQGENDQNDAFSEPLSDPIVVNVTLCGQPASDVDEQVGVVLDSATGGHLSKVIATGYRAGIDVRSETDIRENESLVSRMVLRDSLLFGNSQANVAYDETGTIDPFSDNDQDFPDIDWWLGVAPFSAGNVNNAEGPDPRISGCSNMNEPSFGPATTLPAVESEPGPGGFFEPGGYLGAFYDQDDTWATKGDWVRWRAY